MATNLTFKEQEKNRLKADQLLNAAEASLLINGGGGGNKPGEDGPYRPPNPDEVPGVPPGYPHIPKLAKIQKRNPPSGPVKVPVDPEDIYSRPLPGAPDGHNLQISHGPGQEDIRDKFSYRTDGVLMIDPKRDGTLRPATRDEEESYQLQRLQYEENPYAPFPHEHSDNYGLKIANMSDSFKREGIGNIFDRWMELSKDKNLTNEEKKLWHKIGVKLHKA